MGHKVVNLKPILVTTLSHLNIISAQLIQSYLDICRNSLEMVLEAKFSRKF